MVQRRQDLSLVLELPDDVCGIQALADHLDRHAPLERAVRALRHEHGAHAAMADARLDHIRTDDTADVRIRAFVGRRVRTRGPS